MRKHVFVEPKSTHLHVYSRVTIPRLGSVLLGTLMRDRGYDVRVYIEDIHPIDMQELLSADLVGISAITSTAPQSYRLADEVRRAGIPVVLGGTHASFLPDEALRHADYVVRGEGEEAFVELVEALEGRGDLETIRNLSYLRDGGPVHNPERPKIRDLDVNPIPDYGLIQGWKRGGIVSIATSRGCPFSCTFCSVPGMYGHAFRTHSIDRVLEELRVHSDCSYVFFADDIFTANKRRTKELLSRMIAEGLTPEWGAQVRTETVDDDEMLALMRESNCFNVYVGFESINPKTLKLFQKKQDLAKIERSIARFHDNGIRIHGMFVIGSDEDDLETVDATWRFARARGIDSVQFMILTPIPGSPDWDHIYAKGKVDIISDDWSLYDGHHVVHQPRRISPYELQMGAMKAMRRFYSWGGILEQLAKRDVYTATIRYYGKRIIQDWWKDPVNRGHTEKLKRDLYSEKARRPKRLRRQVAIPAVFMEEKGGAFLQTFLAELGVRVLPLADEAPPASAASEQMLMPLALDTLHRWRQQLDCLIVPMVKRAQEGRDDFYRRLDALNAAIQSNLDRLPRVVPFPLNDEQGPIFETFAKVGLMFTDNLDKIRRAYRQASELLAVWSEPPKDQGHGPEPLLTISPS